jgi:hypothetical protein
VVIIEFVVDLESYPEDPPPGAYCCRIEGVGQSGAVRAVFTGLPHHLMRRHVCVPLTVHPDGQMTVPFVPELSPQAAAFRNFRIPQW